MAYADFEELLRNERDWWARQAVLRILEVGRFGAQSFAALLNISMRQNDPELARAAAATLFSTNSPLSRPYNDCHLTARLLLKSVKIISRAGPSPSLIGEILS
jgi:hypothetical protein